MFLSSLVSEVVLDTICIHYILIHDLRKGIKKDVLGMMLCEGVYPCSKKMWSVI
jgi:hypothetical protein